MTDPQWLRSLALHIAGDTHFDEANLYRIAALLEQYPDLKPITKGCEVEDCDLTAAAVVYDDDKCKVVSACEPHAHEISGRQQYRGCCRNCGCWFAD